jgi:tRNA (mo5U34)-methyltransferase
LKTSTSPASFELTTAEKEVADLLPLEADPGRARAVLDEVPFWFHSFALNREQGIYAPGSARDHRYRAPVIPANLSGMSVLDVGAFDGFYAFLAERRGAARVVAVDNEQYVDWVRARWGIELSGGEGFQAIHRLLGSAVEYRKLDAFDLDRLDESFDFVLCWGILHRVEAPRRLLEVLRRRLTPGGRVLVETHGVFENPDDGDAVHRYGPGEVYPDDEYVYWGFTCGGLDLLAREAGYAGFEAFDAPVIDGHPRIVGTLTL